MEQRLGVCGRVLAGVQAQPCGQLREYLHVGPCLLHRIDHRTDQLQGGQPVALRHVVGLEEGGGR